LIRHSPGLTIGAYEEPQKIAAIRFVPDGVTPGHNDPMRIKDVDPVVLSEVLRLVHTILACAA
jgi:hypothetical protein